MIEVAFRLYNMRVVDGTIAISNDKVALKMGKALLEKYSGKQMEYETDTRVYYLYADYIESTNSWCVEQTYEYKRPDMQWGGSGIRIPYIILNKSTGGVMYINTISDIEDAGIPYFSYEEVLEEYKEGQHGVLFDGFKNTDESTDYIRTAEEAAETAKVECTVEYDSVSVRFDDYKKIWEVCFYKDMMDGGCQTVYLDSFKHTMLIVYGE